jgi:hypothetical protein
MNHDANKNTTTMKPVATTRLTVRTHIRAGQGLPTKEFGGGKV